jgi:hypothetical protein
LTENRCEQTQDTREGLEKRKDIVKLFGAYLDEPDEKRPVCACFTQDREEYDLPRQQTKLIMGRIEWETKVSRIVVSVGLTESNTPAKQRETRHKGTLTWSKGKGLPASL